MIRGTRVPVETVLRKLGAGMTADDILADHPRLTADDIQAAQAFAADYLADEEVILADPVRWIADECVSARLVKLLREAGHDVAYVAEMAAGASDTDLIGLARRENRLLLTDRQGFRRTRHSPALGGSGRCLDADCL